MRFDIFAYGGDMEIYRELMAAYNVEWTDRDIFIEIETIEELLKLAADFKSFESNPESYTWDNPDIVIKYPEPGEKYQTPRIYIYDCYNE